MRTEVVARSAEQWPLQPWAQVVVTAQESRGFEAEDGDAGWRPDTGNFSFAPPAKDRGASAVEWVVITAVVVGLVGIVATVISMAVKNKASKACNDINNVSAGAASGSDSTSCATQ
jgi:hypothetical protein